MNKLKMYRKAFDVFRIVSGSLVLPVLLCVWAPVAVRGGEGDAMTVQQRLDAARPVPHSLNTDDPGYFPIDLWGWETTPHYQRVDPDVVAVEYLMKRAVDESYRRGANILELYRGGWPFDEAEGWTLEDNFRLVRHVHERGMLYHWFPHNLPGGGETALAAVKRLRELASTQNDALALAPELLHDGLGSEHWHIFHALLFNMTVWPYSPHQYFYTDLSRFSSTLPNEIDVAASIGYGVDDQSVDYLELRPVIEKKYGLQYWASQAECRPTLPKTDQWWSAWGGLGYPDWILKQVNDQFRPDLRARGATPLSPSAMWWISEAETVNPDENRRYVYGISQDPIRCAVTTRLTATGQGGATFNGRQLAPRYEMPGSTAFIQNNYFRLCQPDDATPSVLLYDPERLAHYDKNSCAVPLLEPFLETVAAADGPAPEVQAMEVQFVEPAGYKAVMQVGLDLRAAGQVVRETRTFTFYSDSPYFIVEVDRHCDNEPPELETRLGGTALSELFAGERTIAPLPNTAGLQVPLVAMRLDRGDAACRFAVVAPDGLYDEADYESLRAFLQEPEAEAAHAEGECTILENHYSFPVTQIVRLTRPSEHPCHVKEFGRWVFRGVQPSLARPEVAYVKCYLRAHGQAVLQPCGLINNVARAGWGCQYLLDVLDAGTWDGRQVAEVEVKRLTSFIFAPRVEFAEPVGAAWIDGKPWHYFEGRHVFLPNRKGRYRVEAVARQAAEPPHLARTFAVIEQTSLAEGALSFDAALPEWTTGIPEDFFFFAHVRHPERSLQQLSGAELVRDTPGQASIIRFRPGHVVLGFGAGETSSALEPLDFKRETRQYISRMGARELVLHLPELSTELVSLQEIAQQEKPLAGFDVLALYHHYEDQSPVDLSPEAIERIRAFVEAGGGLFVAGEGMRMLPELLNIEAEPPRSQYVWSGGSQPVPEYWGVMPLPAGQQAGLFRDIELIRSPAGPTAVLQNLRGRCSIFNWHRLLRTLWPEDSSLISAGVPLARLSFADESPNPHPASRPAPILWEWRLGEGRVIGMATGLHWLSISPEDWQLQDNMRRLTRNVVEHLGGAGASDPRVGVLW